MEHPGRGFPRQNAIIYYGGMGQQVASTLWTFLLSGLACTGAGILFKWKPEKRAAFFRSINPSLKPALAEKLALGLLAVGAAFLLVFLFEVVPFPRSRPYAIVLLDLLLSPLAIIGFTVIFLLAVFKRGK